MTGACRCSASARSATRGFGRSSIASSIRRTSCCCRCAAFARKRRWRSLATASGCSASTTPTMATAVPTASHGSRRCWRAKASVTHSARSGCNAFRACLASPSSRSASGTATVPTNRWRRSWSRSTTLSASGIAISWPAATWRSAVRCGRRRPSTCRRSVPSPATIASAFCAPQRICPAMRRVSIRPESWHASTIMTTPARSCRRASPGGCSRCRHKRCAPCSSRCRC